jgi:hypothetical protein
MSPFFIRVPFFFAIGTDHVLGNLVALVGAMLISVQTPEGTIALTQQMPPCEFLR